MLQIMKTPKTAKPSMSVLDRHRLGQARRVLTLAQNKYGAKIAAKEAAVQLLLDQAGHHDASNDDVIALEADSSDEELAERNTSSSHLARMVGNGSEAGINPATSGAGAMDNISSAGSMASALSSGMDEEPLMRDDG